MIYELRIYHIYPNRMPNICARFADHTLALFRKHGIEVTDFWLDASGLEKLYYICAFSNEDARKTAWEAFRADPEWNRVKAESEESGPIVEKVESHTMTRAPF